MGKKASGKTYTSKGEHRAVSRKTQNAMRKERNPAEKQFNLREAWLKGQNPWITIDNPNKEETNKRKIRVQANVLWGSPKEYLKKNYVMVGS